MFKARGLYAITNGPRSDLEKAVEAALKGGASIIQYRDKTSDGERRNVEAATLADLSARYAVPLIINDDVDLALACGATGIHLGVGDAGVAATRSRLGHQAIIGVSCYDSLDRARRAVDEGADYVAFGAFHPSPTKPQARLAEWGLLDAARSLGVPLVAIGGITPDNAPSLIAAGADCIAVISSLFDTDDVEAVARRFSLLFS